MKMLKNLKRSFTRFRQRDLATKIFILIGARFYFDWILPTNMTSKNPLYFYCRWYPGGWEAKNRITACYMFGGIHVLFLIIGLVSGFGITLTDIPVNIYPIIIQIYIWIRCKRILKRKIIMLQDAHLA